ncbi:MAG: polysulfide reductase NrfD, partial [Bacteroidales bacterium]|nr:polysulfide reductase NrfD [Bacteroidales bacterium]
MQEEIFISGRNIPHIDPYLEVWHFPISLYLFLGGLAAGIIFFASLFTILKKEKEVPTTVKGAMIVAVIAISVGLVALMYDLTHLLYVW